MAKQFSSKEKHILQFIYLHRNDPTFVLVNVFNEWFDRAGVSFDVETGDILYSLQDINEADVYKMLSDESGIVEIALLIKYLVDNHYIYLIEKDKEDLPKKLGGNWSRLTISNKLPPAIVEIIRQTFRRLYVSYDLIFFVENGFKTDEDLQLLKASENLKASKKQIYISRWSLAVSALALVCTLIVSQYSNCSQNQHNKSMLNALMRLEANYRAINNQNTLELSAHIDSLGVSFSQQNTRSVPTTNPKRVTIKKQYNLIQIDTINCDGKQYLVLPIKK